MFRDVGLRDAAGGLEWRQSAGLPYGHHLTIAGHFKSHLKIRNRARADFDLRADVIAEPFLVKRDAVGAGRKRLEPKFAVAARNRLQFKVNVERARGDLYTLDTSLLRILDRADQRAARRLRHG